ncbi:hypothetical protein CU097_013089 [Rhizopus azygosporus]|uniref:Uncharacterized protein n=1 Tax=Rhizopus azygosporus TaxID=86630 RepID=A0A367K4M9_RHIAZ|nr:hypothetical protein CU097_013089 [Rhizopus azygosporus]
MPLIQNSTSNSRFQTDTASRVRNVSELECSNFSDAYIYTKFRTRFLSRYIYSDPEERHYYARHSLHSRRSLIEDEEDEAETVVTGPRYHASSSNSSSSSSTISTGSSSSSSNSSSTSNHGISSSDEDDTTGTFHRSPIDLYRLAIRTNNEILEDLAAIIRILRQMNTIYRIFNNNNYHSTLGYSAEGDEEEANKLLEAGLSDLQSVLSTEHKRQSTLALLALLTCHHHNEHGHGCSDQYLRQYLDPDGEYDPRLAIFAAAIYDDELELEPKSCRDIMIAAEEICGPAWLDEFHKEKESALRKMLEKLAFVAKIRLKIRDESNTRVVR